MGREWDRVFDVEMDSGLKLKLAMDNGENPYIVADRFLEQHDLPQEFKEQVGVRVQLVVGTPTQETGLRGVRGQPVAIKEVVPCVVLAQADAAHRPLHPSDGSWG